MVKDDQLRSGHRRRLRERFSKSPLRTLPDYEILEILLFDVFKQQDTKAISKKLLEKFSSLKGVITADPIELKMISGIGDATILQFKLIQDIFTRFMLPYKESTVHVMSNLLSVINYCQFRIGTKKTEHFHALFLNKKNTLVADEILNTGTIDKVTIYPREIAKHAILHSASSVIIIHNHPSGDVTPSKDDIDITKKIHAALSALNITLHDHLIVSHNSHFSFKAHNLINHN